MRRSRFRGRARSRRTVAWLPGIATQDTVAGTSSRLIGLTLVAPATNTFGAAISVTTDPDLTLHGGEDAVLTRIRGRLYFSDGRVDAGAGPAANGFQLQVAFVKTDTLVTGAITPMDLTQSFGLGEDQILWLQSVLCSSGVTTGTGTGLDAIDWEGKYIDIDVRAKRKIQVGGHVVMWLQVCLPGGTVSADLRLRGALRILMQRPR